MHSFARPLGLTSFLSLSGHYTCARKHNRTWTIMPWDILISKKLFLQAMWKWDSFTRSKSLHIVPSFRPPFFHSLTLPCFGAQNHESKCFESQPVWQKLFPHGPLSFWKNLFCITMSHPTLLDSLSALLWTLDLCRYSKGVGGGSQLTNLP